MGCVEPTFNLSSTGKEAAPDVEMSIPGLDWGVDEVMGKDAKKVPQKKVPYAKPIPAQFQQVNAASQRTCSTGDNVLGPSCLCPLASTLR